MKTLEEKKKAIFEFLKGKEFKVNDKRASWLLALNLFDSTDVDQEGDRYMELYSPTCGWMDGPKEDLPKIKFKEVQQFIQRTLLEDTYIEVKNEEESEWVQELMFSNGILWGGGCSKVQYTKHRYLCIKDELPIYGGFALRTCGAHEPEGCYKISISYLETLFDTKFEPEGKGIPVDLSKPQEFKMNVKFSDPPPSCVTETYSYVSEKYHEEIVAVIGEERDHLRKRCDEYSDEIEKLKAEVTRLSIQNGLTSARNLDLADERDSLQAEVEKLRSVAEVSEKARAVAAALKALVTSK